MASKLIRCVNGHVFDHAKLDQCPKCGWRPGATPNAATTDESADNLKSGQGQSDAINGDTDDGQAKPQPIDRRLIVGGLVGSAVIAAAVMLRPSPRPPADKTTLADNPQPAPKPDNTAGIDKPAKPETETSRVSSGPRRFRDLPAEDQAEQREAARKLGLSNDLTEAVLATRVRLLCGARQPDERALRQLRNVVDTKHPLALQTAGFVVRDGAGVTVDDAEAAGYFAAAADAGLARARVAYADMITSGKIPGAKPNDAMQLLVLAARSGRKEARDKLAAMTPGIDVAQLIGQTVDDLIKAVNSGDWVSAVTLADVLTVQKITLGFHYKGVCLYEGRGGVKPDREAAMPWFRLSMRNGSGPPAGYFADYMANRGPGVNAAETLVWNEVGRNSYSTDREKAVFTRAIWDAVGLLNREQWKLVRTLFAGVDVIAPT